MGDAFARILHVPLDYKFLLSGGGMNGVGQEHGLYTFFVILGLTGVKKAAAFSFHPCNDDRRDVEIKLLSLG